MAARKTTSPPAAAEQDPQDVPQEAEQASAPTAVESAYVDALRREREGYLRYEQTDRAGGVEAELKRLGAPLERAVTAPPETA